MPLSKENLHLVSFRSHPFTGLCTNTMNARFLFFETFKGRQDAQQPAPWVDPDAVPPGEALKKFAKDLTELGDHQLFFPLILQWSLQLT